MMVPSPYMALLAITADRGLKSCASAPMHVRTCRRNKHRGHGVRVHPLLGMLWPFRLHSSLVPEANRDLTKNSLTWHPFRPDPTMAAATATAGAAAAGFRLAVCGLHLRAQPLNPQLTDLQSTFLRECRSTPDYR